MSSSDIEYTGDKSKAVLVGVINSHQDENKVREYLDELDFLATTAVVPLPKNGSRTRSPSLDEATIILLSISSGFCVG